MPERLLRLNHLLKPNLIFLDVKRILIYGVENGKKAVEYHDTTITGGIKSFMDRVRSY